MLFSTHDAYWQNNTNLNDVLGKLYKFEWDPANNAILYEGEVYDESGARKIYANLVNGISAGFLYQVDTSGYNYDIEIKEATVTYKPHAKSASIKAVVEA